MLQFNGVEAAAYPSKFQVGLLDLDAEEGTGRTADGKGYRSRVARKRQIEMEWGPLTWAQSSSLLRAVEDEYFSCTYPDPYSGQYETKVFYVGDRTSPFTSFRGSDIVWSGLRMTITEQ